MVWITVAFMLSFFVVGLEASPTETAGRKNPWERRDDVIMLTAVGKE